MQKAKKIADSNIDFRKKKKPTAKNNNAKGQSMVFVLSINKIELEKANKQNKNLFFSTKTLAKKKIDKQKKVKLKMLDVITPKLQDTKPRTVSGMGCPYHPLEGSYKPVSKNIKKELITLYESPSEK